MVETTQKFIDEIKELEKNIIKYVIENDNEVSNDELNLFIKMKTLIDLSTEVMLLQSEILEENSTKLDTILSLLKK